MLSGIPFRILPAIDEAGVVTRAVRLMGELKGREEPFCLTLAMVSLCAIAFPASTSMSAIAPEASRRFPTFMNVLLWGGIRSRRLPIRPTPWSALGKAARISDPARKRQERIAPRRLFYPS